MAELNRAYALVRSPELRRAYDRSCAGRQAVGPGFATPPPAEEPASAAPPSGPFARAVERNGRDDRPPSSTITFGRYAGWKLVDLVRHDTDYLRWLARHSAGLRFREEIARLLPAEPDLKRRAGSRA